MNLIFLFILSSFPSYSDFLNIYSGNFVSRGYFISNFFYESDYIKENPAFFKKDTMSFCIFFNPYYEKDKLKDLPYFLSLTLIFPFKDIISGIDFDFLSKERFTVYSGGGEVIKNYVPKSFYIGTFLSKKLKIINYGLALGISKIEEPKNIWPYEPDVFYIPSIGLGTSLVFKRFDLSLSLLNIGENIKKKDGEKIYSPISLNFNSSFNLNIKNIKIVPGINYQILKDYKGRFKSFYGIGAEFIKRGNPEIYLDSGYIIRERKGFVYGIKIKYYNFKLILNETGILTDYKKFDLHLGIETFFELIEI